MQLGSLKINNNRNQQQQNEYTSRKQCSKTTVVPGHSTFTVGAVKYAAVVRGAQSRNGTRGAVKQYTAVCFQHVFVFFQRLSKNKLEYNRKQQKTTENNNKQTNKQTMRNRQSLCMEIQHTISHLPPKHAFLPIFSSCWAAQPVSNNVHCRYPYTMDHSTSCRKLCCGRGPPLWWSPFVLDKTHTWGGRWCRGS